MISCRISAPSMVLMVPSSWPSATCSPAGRRAATSLPVSPRSQMNRFSTVRGAARAPRHRRRIGHAEYGKHPLSPRTCRLTAAGSTMPQPPAFGGDRRDADLCRRRAGGAADRPVRAWLLPDHVAEPVGSGQASARPRPGQSRRARTAPAPRPVAAVRVDHRIRAGDQLGEGGVRQPLGQGSRRVAGEAPVEVLAVLGNHERAASRERRQVEHRHHEDAAAQAAARPGPRTTAAPRPSTRTRSRARRR